jgi:hypothetical protein
MRLPPNAIDALEIQDPRQNQLLQSSVMEVARHAYSIGGMQAFEATERTAAVHEAGHATLYAVYGIPVKQLWIKSIKADGVRTWIGRCETDWGWHIDERTPPIDDLRIARIIMAGALAEMVFATDEFRDGSSLDETVLAGSICRTAAHKLGRSPSDIVWETMAETLDVLHVYERHVRGLATGLMRSRRLQGPKLDRLLPAEVRRG